MNAAYTVASWLTAAAAWAVAVVVWTLVWKTHKSRQG